MNSFFSLLFLVGLCKFFWDKYKSSMFVMVVNNLLASKFGPTPEGISKGTKDISGAYHIDYTINGTKYALVIPPQKRKVKWNKATAEVEDGVIVEITDLVKPYAGPHGNFMNFDYHPHHLHRNAKTITIYHNDVVVRQFGPNL